MGGYRLTAVPLASQSGGNPLAQPRLGLLQRTRPADELDRIGHAMRVELAAGGVKRRSENRRACRK